MAQYLVLAPTHLQPLGTSSGPSLQATGSTVGFDGEPGVSLFPLDADARTAYRQMMKRRNAFQRGKIERQIGTYRRGLPKLTRDVLDAARAELEADNG